MKRKTYLLIIFMLLLSTAVLMVARCLRVDPPPMPTPVTVTATHTPTPTGTAVPSPTNTPTPSPTIDTLPGTTTPFTPTSPPPTGTAVPTITPTLTPSPSPTPYTVFTVASIHSTLWWGAWRYCGNANLWPILASANGVKNPRHLQMGDVIVVQCK